MAETKQDGIWHMERKGSQGRIWTKNWMKISGASKKKGRSGAVAFLNLGESAAALPCCISSAMRGLTFLPGTWGAGRERGGGPGRTQRRPVSHRNGIQAISAIQSPRCRHVGSAHNKRQFQLIPGQACRGHGEAQGAFQRCFHSAWGFLEQAEIPHLFRASGLEMGASGNTGAFRGEGRS